RHDHLDLRSAADAARPESDLVDTRKNVAARSPHRPALVMRASYRRPSEDRWLERLRRSLFLACAIFATAAPGAAPGAADGVADRLRDGVADRLRDGVADRLRDGVADRLRD